jgi:hypothetical protein
MDVKQLQELGGFVSPEPVEKEITWTPPNGGEPVILTAHIKKLPFGQLAQLFAIEDTRERMSRYISEAMFTDASGKRRVFTYEQAYQLEPSLAPKFMEAIGAVNGTAKVTVIGSWFSGLTDRTVVDGLVITRTFSRLVAYSVDILFLGLLNLAVLGALGLFDRGYTPLPITSPDASVSRTRIARGSSLSPIRSRSIARAAWRPSSSSVLACTASITVPRPYPPIQPFHQ